MFQRRLKKRSEEAFESLIRFTYTSRLDFGDEDEHELVLVYNTANPKDHGCCQGDQRSKRGIYEANSNHEQ
jgi:hypothetical protein